MMWKFQGAIDGSVDTIAQKLPMVVKNYRLVNVSGGSVNVNVYMINNSTAYSVGAYPQNLSAGALYEDEVPMLLDAAETVRIVTNGLVHYTFTFENTKPITEQ